MTTAADRAQELELAEYQRNQRPAAPSAKYCTDATCGDEIPEGRREYEKRMREGR